MRHVKTILLLAVIALMGGNNPAPSAKEPVNACIMIPEVVNGRTAGRNMQRTGYEPESCIASRAFTVSSATS